MGRYWKEYSIVTVQSIVWSCASKQVVLIVVGNLFSKTNGTWELILEEKALFEISENKNLSKITSYTVVLYTY